MTMTKQQQQQQQQQQQCTAAAPVAATIAAAPASLAQKLPVNASSSVPKITFAAAAAQAAMSSSESTSSNAGTAGSVRRVSVTMKKNGDYSVAIAEGDVASVNLKTAKPVLGGTRDKIASSETLGSLTRSTAAITISSTRPPAAQSSPTSSAAAAAAAAAVISGPTTHAKLHSSLPQLPAYYPNTTGFNEMRRRTIGGLTPSPPRMGGGGLVSGNSFNSLQQQRSTSSTGLPLTPMRRRASTNMSVTSQASNSGGMSGLTPALASAAATYTQAEIYSFLLVSKELAAAADFLCQLLHLGGLHDEILLSEFKTILVDLMAERFSQRAARRCRRADTIHMP